MSYRGRLKEDFLLRWCLFWILTLMSIVAVAALGWSQSANTASLQGEAPFNFNVLPPLPPNGFYAWCETPHGICAVRGNAPIPPGSVCHCAEFEGRTA
jgi:hypothetical protein